MSRVLFAKGARGDLIKKIQETLTLSGFDTKGIDGIFGNNTHLAVVKFQQSAGNLQVTGEIDSDTYQQLMGTEPPVLRDRSLQLTAVFEGHGFGLAQGNFDGAGITWGIIGFTLKHGEIKKIILGINEIDSSLVYNCFQDNADQLLTILNSSWTKQLAFANSISLGSSKAKLAEPWRSAFMEFGSFPEVQAIQCELVDKDYFQPACQTANEFNLITELGITLAFDIHVQNGGIKHSARELIDQQLHENSISNERDLRMVIANAVADKANPKYREDVRARKTTIATGAGKVHGSMFLLRNWGLDDLIAE